MSFVENKKQKKWEISLVFVHTFFTLGVLFRITSNAIFFVFGRVRYQCLLLIDLSVSNNFIFADGWFCAGPSPVYQHHHHPRPYAHIPSSPYDRLGIRGHRPSPYPNPYHKRTDLPTQGNYLSFSQGWRCFAEKTLKMVGARFENYWSVNLFG